MNEYQAICPDCGEPMEFMGMGMTELQSSPPQHEYFYGCDNCRTYTSLWRSRPLPPALPSAKGYRRV